MPKYPTVGRWSHRWTVSLVIFCLVVWCSRWNHGSQWAPKKWLLFVCLNNCISRFLEGSWKNEKTWSRFWGVDRWTELTKKWWYTYSKTCSNHHQDYYMFYMSLGSILYNPYKLHWWLFLGGGRSEVLCQCTKVLPSVGMVGRIDWPSAILLMEEIRKKHLGCIKPWK